MPTAKSQTLSIGLHLAVLALLLFLTSQSVLPPPAAVIARRIVPLAPIHRVYVDRAETHSGGGNQTLLPARHGEPPPQAHNTFIPPKSLPNPKLPMAISVAFDSPTVQIDAGNIGDPLGNLNMGGLGSHGRDSIGPGGCCGIGPGKDGTPGISTNARRRSATAPQLIYKVEPEFSEEARKAKFSGMVVLSIEVDATGKAGSFRVLESPGLGLEEKAIEAVKQWRFRPGYVDGKPVVTTATVQVSFRLL